MSDSLLNFRNDFGVLASDVESLGYVNAEVEEQRRIVFLVVVVAAPATFLFFAHGIPRFKDQFVIINTGCP